MRIAILGIAVLAALFLGLAWRTANNAQESDFSFVIPALIGAVLTLADVALIGAYALFRLFA